MKEVIIILLILMNGAYYAHLLHYWNELTYDGVVGKSILGVILSFISIILMFSLDSLL